MDHSFLLTVLFAALIMGLVIAALSIGLILTGKSRLRRGCGVSPKKRNSDKKGDSTCSICGDKTVCKKEEENDATRMRKRDRSDAD